MTLNKIIPDWDGDKGLFSQLEELTRVPWEGVNAAGLDVAYHGQRSGDKYIASWLYRYVDDEALLTDAGYNKISNAVEARYYQKWKHLWGIYTAEYNPLDTYNVVETVTSNEKSATGDKSVRTPNLTTRDVLDQNDTDNHTTTNALTHGEKIATDSTTNTEDKNNLFGFNSTTSVPTSEPTSKTTSNATETHSGTDNETGSVNGTNTRDATNTRTETGNDTTQRDVDTETTVESSRNRKGNMYRSPAELLDFDRNFWYEDYFSIVFADMDDLLTLAIYSEQTPRLGVF